MDLSDLRQYRNLELLARQLVEGFVTGLHKSPYHGFSVEFAEHKAYNPGEGTRYMDWKLFARTDRLYTRRFEEETNLRCMMLVDASPSMYYPRPGHDKIRFAGIAAAALAWLLQGQRDACGLTLFSDKIEQQTQVKSTAQHTRRLLTILDEVMQRPAPKEGNTHLTDVLHQVADQQGQRSLVVIFSDMLTAEAEREEELLTALRHLRHNKHEVVLFHIVHGPTELRLDLPNRPTIFVDAESGARITANPAQLRERYETEVATRFAELKLRCAQNRIDLVEADVTKGVHPILQAYLVKRGKMG